MLDPFATHAFVGPLYVTYGAFRLAPFLKVSH